MGQYIANSVNVKDFTLSLNNVDIGVLRYTKWYSFEAGIVLADHSSYQLQPKGFWKSKIELTKDNEKWLDFEMGWKGIIINFSNSEEKYLLQLKGFLDSRFVLVDTNEKELLAIEADFKWKKFIMDFNIETSNEFDSFENKEILLFTTVHCVNYYMAFANGFI